MVYKLTVTVYSSLWTWSPVAFVKNWFWTCYWNQVLINSIAVILYCTDESLQGEINSQLNMRHVISCAGVFARRSFILPIWSEISLNTPLKKSHWISQHWHCQPHHRIHDLFTNVQKQAHTPQPQCKKELKWKITTCPDHSLEQLMNSPEDTAYVYEVRGLFPCLFSTNPTNHQHLLIGLIIPCLSCDGTHAWQMNPYSRRSHSV